MIRNLLQDFIRNISGPLGIRIRRAYYVKQFKSCGKNLVISEGVFFDNPSNISLGEDVWIDKHCIFITGKLNRKNCKHIEVPLIEGEIKIGNSAHLGIRSILQAHGGISIGDYFTCGADAKLYTLSNDVYLSHKGTHNLNKDELFYVMHPIEIGTNVWIGMQSMIIGGKIGDNVFLKANSIVGGNINQNSISAGVPAEILKLRFK